MRLNWKGQRWFAHRLVYTLLASQIPGGLTLDHVKARGCRSRACCWPAHLEPVTNGENVLRGDGRSAVNAVRTACVNGHEFTLENTFVRKDGRRDCRECMRARSRRQYHEVAEREGRAVVPYGNRTHCPGGHEYTETNSYWHQGTRACRICRRERCRQWRMRRTAARLVAP